MNHHHQRNSLLLFLAANIASINVDLKLFFSSIFKAEIVVPPGDVTIFLKSEIVKLDSFNKERVHSKKNNAKELILGLFSIYEVLWDYRYLVRDSFEQFSTDNPNLYKKIIDINCEIDDWAEDAIIHAKDNRVLIIQNEDIESLVEMSLIIGRHWLDYSMKKYPFKSDLYLRKKGINLLIRTLYPYLSGDSKNIMDSIYESD